MKIVKGYLTFNLKDDIYFDFYKRKKYSLEKQRKQCDKAYKELKKQESKGLITNLTFTELNGKVTMTWERVS